MTSPTSPKPHPRDKRSLWQPTTSMLRSLIGGVVLMSAALILGRPDLLVLGAPFVIISLWSLMTRPSGDPKPVTSLAHRSLREGEATTWHTTMTAVPGMEHAVVAVAPGRWIQLAPISGVLARTITSGNESPGATSTAEATGEATAQTSTGTTSSDEAAPHTSTGTTSPGSGRDVVRLDIRLQSRRWGQRQVGSGLIAAHSAWGAFRFGPHECASRTLSTLPLPATFDAKAPTPHPNGLVGLNRSRRAGDGSEFASIRAFQPGDRLRRIHWPLSLRAGELYVTSTWADQDSHVMLIVDALNDLGQSQGLGRAASSLDVTVRAAGAMAEHYLRRGDRVGVRVFGSVNIGRLPAVSGHSHLRRVLDTLASIEAGTEPEPNSTRIAGGMPEGALVILLSPLVSPDALTHAVTMGRRGLSVIIIDTLPDQVGRADVTSATRAERLFAQTDRQAQSSPELAWRIRRLEREREIRRVQQFGIPIVAWRGPGSLDQVLRDLGRRSSAARMARR